MAEYRPSFLNCCVSFVISFLAFNWYSLTVESRLKPELLLEFGAVAELRLDKCDCAIAVEPDRHDRQMRATNRISLILFFFEYNFDFKYLPLGL